MDTLSYQLQIAPDKPYRIALQINCNSPLQKCSQNWPLTLIDMYKCAQITFIDKWNKQTIVACSLLPDVCIFQLKHKCGMQIIGGKAMKGVLWCTHTHSDVHTYIHGVCMLYLHMQVYVQPPLTCTLKKRHMYLFFSCVEYERHCAILNTHVV